MNATLRRPRVALLVETALVYGREIHLGIADYVRTHGSWSIYVEQSDLSAELPQWFSRQKWEGILARTTSPAFVENFKKQGIPIIDLNDRDSNLGLPRVRSDDIAIGRLAVDHLLERGFRNLGFCGFQGEEWSVRREQGFQQLLKERGIEGSIYQSHWRGPRAQDWDTDMENLEEWLKRLPRPLGIVACSDVRGQHVLEICRRLELSVPEDVAVVGVDNDELLCQLCDPPLSSVAPNARHVGYIAAEILDRMMAGESVPPDETHVPPIGVVTRHSSDTTSIDDPLIASAIRFVRDHACQGIRVEDILKNVPISRSQLEQKFRKLLGRTPHAEIRKVQMQRMIQLLTETELPLKNIASRVGFPHLEYMNYFFKRETGQTPGEYRRTHGSRAVPYQPDVSASE